MRVSPKALRRPCRHTSSLELFKAIWRSVSEWGCARRSTAIPCPPASRIGYVKLHGIGQGTPTGHAPPKKPLAQHVCCRINLIRCRIFSVSRTACRIFTRSTRACGASFVKKKTCTQHLYCLECVIINIADAYNWRTRERWTVGASAALPGYVSSHQ